MCWLPFVDYQSYYQQKKWKWQVANDVREDPSPFYWRFEQTQVDVLDHFIPESPSFRLTNLLPNTSYVFAMMCHRFGGPDRPSSALTITSDPIFFTTSKSIYIRNQKRRKFSACPYSLTEIQLLPNVSSLLYNNRRDRVRISTAKCISISFSLPLSFLCKCNQHSNSLSAPRPLDSEVVYRYRL